MTRVRMLYFNAKESDLLTMYERLAIREKLIIAPMNKIHPGASMMSVDLIRNLILAYFDGAAAQISAYEELWVPMETAVRAASGEAEEAENCVQLETIFMAFLKEISHAQACNPPAGCTAPTGWSLKV